LIAKVACDIDPVRPAIDASCKDVTLVKIKSGALVVGPELRSRAMVMQRPTFENRLRQASLG